MSVKNGVLNYLTLFTSFSTLICCALPSLFVMLGLGAVVSGLISTFPQIVWLSEHKVIVFSVSGLIILFNYIFYFKQKNQSCPIDESQDACDTARTWSFRILVFSTIMWMTGVFFAFIIFKII